MARKWRVCKALRKLQTQINIKFPKRSKLSDGTIGDAAHASRSSDHNPWVVDAQGFGVVTAIDITHDIKGGVDCNVLAERLKDDPRVKYVIWNRRIHDESKSPNWRPYRGKNGHTQHVHISVHAIPRLYDNERDWTF